jgi:hypothetical protein
VYNGFLQLGMTDAYKHLLAEALVEITPHEDFSASVSLADSFRVGQRLFGLLAGNFAVNKILQSVI